jgi:hypothetical protein
MQLLCIFFLFYNFNLVSSFYFNTFSKNIIWDKKDFIDKKYISVFSNNTIKVNYLKNELNFITKSIKINNTCKYATLIYNLFFPYNFDFVKGGKLPGLYGGDIEKGCSGCEHSNKCFSTRLMWRKNGKGEVYLYIPNNNNLNIKKENTNDCGISLGRGNFTFIKDNWIEIKQQIKLNDINKNNGFIKLWINSELYIYHYNMIFKDNENVKINGILFSTFFGGHDLSWVPKKDMFALFSNFSFTCDEDEDKYEDYNKIYSNNSLYIKENYIFILFIISIFFICF